MRLTNILAFVCISAAPCASFAQDGLHLIPHPREIKSEGATPLSKGIAVGIPRDADDQHTARDLIDALKNRHIIVDPSAPVRIAFIRSDRPQAISLLKQRSIKITPEMQEEGYVIISDARGLVIIAPSATGMFYGAQTVKQLVRGSGTSARLERATIKDWPAMRYRGFHDDLSRGPVPTIDFQKKQIRVLAAYKVNVYSPYYEHTLFYPSNPLIAPPGGAMTPDQVRELVAYAARYHIDVIPEQEAFGHLHHVLKYELYSALGETPHGHVLAPGQPGSLPLIRQFFAHIDSLFPSHFIHIGADETFELGRGQTAERVRTEGIGTVYLDFLKQIEVALRPTGKRFLFWGDVAMNHPDLVKTLPKSLVPVAWTYGADTSFVRYIAPFRNAGMETWVAPGVSSWNRVYPDNAIALVNIQRFVRDGQRLGATGVLNTSWDDDGEALFNQTWYGVLFGAAAGWQQGESSIGEFENSYGLIFHDDTTGYIDQAQRKLSAAHALLTKAGVGDASDYLFWLDPWSDEGKLIAQRIRPVTHDLRILAESAMVYVSKADRPTIAEHDALDAMALGARRIDFIGMKFQFADEVVQLYAHASDTTKTMGRDLADITGVNGRLQDLRDGLSLIRDEYEKLWLKENRPYWLHNVLARYDQATQLWLNRADRINLSRQQWNRVRRLSPAATIGVPDSMPGLAPLPPS